MPGIRQIVGRLAASCRVLFRSRQLEHDMDEEMRFHVEMEADRLVRDERLDPHSARRQAFIRFGGIESHKELGRDARGRRWLDAVTTDLRLAVRMLAKYRGLTVVGAFAMAVAVGIGATAFEVFGEMLTPALPFENGDRIVSVQYPAPVSSAGTRDVAREVRDRDAALTSLDDLGAFRTTQQNIVAPPAAPGPIRIAEITASAFALTRTPALRGRTLLASDEAPGATPVLVISERVWRTRFASDAGILGRIVMLGGHARAIVGVMPEGFAFPIDHDYWMPFRPPAPAAARRTTGTVYVFGRLTPGTSMAQAQSELLVVARRDAAKGPERDRLTVAVAPYTHTHVDLDSPGMTSLVRLGQLLTGALTVVVAINLAILIYARTVTRSGELAVRSALGASRTRILAQLFMEALTLSLTGAVLGLAASAFILRSISAFARAAGRVPFWLGFDLSAATAVSVLALAAVAALIMGVLPGLKATGRRVNATLHQLSGRAAPRLGPVWTSLIVAQVAAAVAILPVACYLVWQTIAMDLRGPGFPAETFAMTLVDVADDVAADEAATRERLRALMTRMRQEPGVRAVTWSSNVPGFAGGATLEFDSDAGITAPAPYYVSRLDVAADMLDVFGAKLIAGRLLTAADTGATGAAVVNETFAKWVAGPDRAVGVRFRYADVNDGAAAGPWQEIVGVVEDLPRRPEALNLDTPAVVFHASALGRVSPVFIAARFDDAVPDGFGPRMLQIGATLDSKLQVRQSAPLMAYYDQLTTFWRAISWGAGAATLAVLLLSAAGMYALMSFMVAQRRREIGIRVALGAQPRRLFGSIFGRAMWQLGLGIAAGSAISALLAASARLDLAMAAGMLTAVAAIMITVGLLAAVGPARRSLRVAAAEALRGDGET